MRETCIILFAKAPVAGKVKTRLIPALGAKLAAELARKMLDYAIEQCSQSQADHLMLATAPHPDSPDWEFAKLPDSIQRQAQPEGDLGTRLSAMTATALQSYRKVVLIGSDCPALDHRRLDAVLGSLDTHELSIIPALDGGYVALGLTQFHPEIFENIPWSQSRVCERTLENAAELGLDIEILTPLADIDRPEDLIYLTGPLAGFAKFSPSEQEIA